jgi:preprotein translocase subunit SecD
MYRRNMITLLILTLIFALSIAALVVNPVLGRDGMRLGLDLQGGIYLEYQVQFPEGTLDTDRENMINQAVEKIRTRIDRFGITEPIVQSLGNERIIVQLPGFSDIAQAKALVEQTGFLEFREVELNTSGSPVTLNDYLTQTELTFIDKSETGDRFFANENQIVLAILQKNEEDHLYFVDIDGNTLSTDTLKKGDVYLYSWIAARGTDGTQLTGALLTSATPDVENTTTGSLPIVKIVWNSDGSVIFDQIAARLYVRTQNTVQRALGIFLDKKLLSAPEVNAQSYGGTAIIEGNFTAAQVTTLANLLSSGSLPMPLQRPPVYENTVSATLGANFTRMGIIGGIVGALLVILFMILYYRIPGMMASLALLFYGALLLAIFKLLPVTISLAGIGGFVLSVGMAVDANVLIFERMKEELRNGRTLKAAIEAGFDRAWLAIRDSNITTFISCLVLYWIGGLVPNGAPIKGFALTLFIGAAVSMFTAIVVTRSLLRLFVGTAISQRISLFSAFIGRK